jgi:peptide chain release factor 2
MGSGATFDLPVKAVRRTQLQERMQTADFWGDPEKAQEVLKEESDLREALERDAALRREIDDLEVLLELGREEGDASVLAEVEAGLEELRGRLRALELQILLAGPYDRGNAILTVNAGAGGTESQDWAQMLLRMYLRWAETRGFEAEVIDELKGEEAGIKNATVTVNGPYAYGTLRGENGVHRLVRMSPFDASKRRHTSFASVGVIPQVEDDITVTIDEKDLQIETFRSSGAGGQHVNVTDSAVRIRHLPSGIGVSCQNERSQHKNRATAMKVLRARLSDLYRRQREAELAKLEGEKMPIGFGSQIRSYVMAPYQLVKDHRTGYETGNVQAVLDGALDPLLEAFLLSKGSAQGSSP